MWITELDTEKLTKGINATVVEDFLDCWKSDLRLLKNEDSPYNKEDAIRIANAYLKYFGSAQHVINVDWDRRKNTFMWNVKDNLV